MQIMLLRRYCRFTALWIISTVIACFFCFALIQILVQPLYLFIKSVMDFSVFFKITWDKDEGDLGLILVAFQWVVWVGLSLMKKVRWTQELQVVARLNFC